MGFTSHQPGDALRTLDRTWRTNPADRSTLAPLYAHLLVQQGKDWSGAISLLGWALRDCPTPDLEADFAYVLLRTGQTQAALHRLASALARFAVVPGSALALRAREVLAAASVEYIGWAGITPKMLVYAEAAAGAGPTLFVLRGSDGRVLASRLFPASSRRRAKVEFPVPKTGGFSVTANDRALLGGEQQLPVDFRVDGRAVSKRGVITGWARIGWHPDGPPRVLIRDERGTSKRVMARAPAPGSRWGFQLDARGMHGDRFEICILLPDGSNQALPDSPLLTPAGARASLALSASRARPRKLAGMARPIDVIIPVFQDRDATIACIRAVSATSADEARSIIVIDDASPDPTLSADLEDLARAGTIKLLRNERNLGFSQSVNRAMELNPQHDAVLVNSDVVVFGNWLTRLRRAAFSSPSIGTVTPMADDDSIVGYVHGRVGPDAVAAAAELDRVSAKGQTKAVVDLPVGVGFCMFIRRDCWEATGPFDAEVFAQGYGEEADFCMRARKLGWRHVLAVNVFAHHAGSKSFGSRRAALLDRSSRLLNLRHPGYDAFVAKFAEARTLDAVRRKLDIHRLRSMDGTFVLIVTLALPGGVDRFVADRSRQIRLEGQVPLVLKPVALDGMEECALLCEELQASNLQFHIPPELNLLRELLGSLRIHSIEHHHFLGLHPRVITMLQRLGLPIDAYIHDYSWVCPRVTLIDGSGSYCGEPAVSVCEVCIRRNGSYLPEQISVAGLRRRSASWLRLARRVIAPTADTAQRLQRYMPALKVAVVPHEVFMPSAAAPEGAERATVRVALIGAIGHHKGYKVLLQCARDASRRRLPLEFVVIGYSENDARLTRTGRVFVTGKYGDPEVGYLLRREAPDLVFLPSVWPETWCYTLTHAIASGLPMVAFDIGAIAERLRAEGKGTLLRLGLSPREINDHLIGLVQSNRLPRARGKVKHAESR